MDLNKLQEGETTLNSALLIGTFCFLNHKVNGWIIDSRVYDNLCNNIELFYTYEPLVGTDHLITIPDGKLMRVSIIGDIKLNNEVWLRGVLFVPDFQSNLMPVKKLCETEKYNVSFLIAYIMSRTFQ